ncbi:YetF domain-containing protein [Caldibacillus thermoamylovorans]
MVSSDHRMGKTEQWLTTELQRQGITSPKDVLIAEWLEGDGWFVQTHQPNSCDDQHGG